MVTRSNQVRQDLHSTATQHPQRTDSLLLPSPTTEGGSSPEGVSSTYGASSPSEEAQPQQAVAVTTATSDKTKTSHLDQSSRPLPGVRRSARSNKGQYSFTRYINEVFCQQ